MKLRLIVGMLAILVCQQVWAEPVPPLIEMKYRVSIAGLKIGEGVDRFQHDGKTYQVVSESKTVGIAAIYRLNIRREAKGLVTPDGLRPQSYLETRNGEPKRSALFDWKAKQATLTTDGNKHTETLLENTWDTTSFGYNFAFVERDAANQDLDIYVTDGRRLTRYRYTMVGREKLETGMGALNTLHVRKVLEGDDKRAFEVWLAVDHHYLPVRIYATEKDGTAFDSTVTQISYPAR